MRSKYLFIAIGVLNCALCFGLENYLNLRYSQLCVATNWISWIGILLALVNNK